MRNPGTDFHRRQADADHTRELIAGNKRSVANAAEWERRAALAFKLGNPRQAYHLLAQAALELRATPFA